MVVVGAYVDFCLHDSVFSSITFRHVFQVKLHPGSYIRGPLLFGNIGREQLIKFLDVWFSHLNRLQTPKLISIFYFLFIWLLSLRDTISWLWHSSVLLWLLLNFISTCLHVCQSFSGDLTMTWSKFLPPASRLHQNNNRLYCTGPVPVFVLASQVCVQLILSLNTGCKMRWKLVFGLFFPGTLLVFHST